MQSNTDGAAQKRRKKEALKSAFTAAAIMLLSAGLLLFLRFRYAAEGLAGAVMTVLAVMEIGAVIPVFILLKTRFKEIEGGEEDAAAQY